jgi:hypothetical protein
VLGLFFDLDDGGDMFLRNVAHNTAIRQQTLMDTAPFKYFDRKNFAELNFSVGAHGSLVIEAL